MRASIVIACYNGADYLEKCLSALMLEVKDDELILVDNASSDGSADLVEQRWTGVKLIANESNRGFAAACNQGAREASGEYLVFLNQDTQVRPGWLAGLLDGLNGGEGVGLVTSKLLILSQPDRIQTCGQDIHFTGLTFGRGSFSNSDKYLLPETVGAVSGASFALRRSLWEKMGGFDEDFFMYYEETDLSWRAQALGYSCVLSPQSVVAHDYSKEKSINCLYYSERNRKFMLLKNYKLGTILLIFPAILFTEVLQWLNMCTFGIKAIYAKFRADLWVLRNIRTISQIRKTQAQHSTIPDYKILGQRSYRIKILEKPHTTAVIVAIPIVNFFYQIIYSFTLAVLKIFRQ